MRNFNVVRKYGAGAVLVASLMAPAFSFAAIDVTTLTTAISDGATAIGVVALAVLGVIALVHSFKLIRRAF